MKNIFSYKTIKTVIKIQYIFLFMILSFFSTTNSINNTIILFVEKYPTVKIPKNKETLESLSAKLKQPKYLWKNVISQKRITSGINGIMAMHLGNSCLSDKDGQIIFQRTFQQPIVHLLITKGIQPAFMIAPETVHNWMLEKNTPAILYQFKFHQDEDTELYYIETKKVPLPKDSMITFDTIIIIADPKSVYVPSGATITNYSANLILPNIYIKKDFDFEYNTLRTNAIGQYFESIKSEYKPEEQTLAKIITNV